MYHAPEEFKNRTKICMECMKLYFFFKIKTRLHIYLYTILFFEHFFFLKRLPFLPKRKYYTPISQCRACPLIMARSPKRAQLDIPKNVIEIARTPNYTNFPLRVHVHGLLRMILKSDRNPHLGAG